MKERPIPFLAQMVRAILEGRKTQTRRIIKPEWYRCLDLEDPDDVAKALAQCYYGQPGDSLWVRETWQAEHGGAWWGELATDHPEALNWNMYYRATEDRPIPAYWRPSIFMPRWASRITLEIVNMGVERLRDITPGDIMREGCPKDIPYIFDWFINLWNFINARRGYGWDTNPWVWVIEFKVNQ